MVDPQLGTHDAHPALMALGWLLQRYAAVCLLRMGDLKLYFVTILTRNYCCWHGSFAVLDLTNCLVSMVVTNRCDTQVETCEQEMIAFKNTLLLIPYLKTCRIENPVIGYIPRSASYTNWFHVIVDHYTITRLTLIYSRDSTVSMTIRSQQNQ